VKKIRSLFVLISIIAFIMPGIRTNAGATGRLVVTITNSHGAPLEGVGLTLVGVGKDVQYSLQTNEKGKATLSDAPPIFYTMTVEKDGCETRSGRVKLRAGCKVKQHLRMLCALLEAQEQLEKTKFRDSLEREPEQVDSECLERTRIIAHMKSAITVDENLIYCSTFQIAWNLMQNDIVKDQIFLQGDPEIAQKPIFQRTVITLLLISFHRNFLTESTGI